MNVTVQGSSRLTDDSQAPPQLHNTAIVDRSQSYTVGIAIDKALCVWDIVDR
ncbi:hypothetical protein BS17DRAFT_776251 [Gyrodon lividus]|nr:hypothetical protein BS17DRAFT_776251 [Gyrodon lividus]